MSDKILIIEDDLLLAEALLDVLEIAGYEAESIHDGAIALDYLQNNRPNLILLDMHLPNVGGMEILQTVKDDSIFDETYVIVMTADKHLRNEAEKHTMALQKPVAAKELIQIVRGVLNSNT